MANITGFVLVLRDATSEGCVRVAHGTLSSLRGDEGDVATDNGHFRLPRPGDRIEAWIDDARMELGAFATRVTIHLARTKGIEAKDAASGFTFFLRDVTTDAPLFVPAFGAAILPTGDVRTYEQVARQVRDKTLLSQFGQIEAEPEETYESACIATRDQKCPTWLGLGRDVRIFRVSPLGSGNELTMGYWGQIEPWNHSTPRDAPENPKPIQYLFAIGRGVSCSVDNKRWLEDGALPILRSLQRDGDVEYDVTMFATLETRPLSPGAGVVRGTHDVAAFANTGGHMLSDAEKGLYETTLRESDIRNREEEVVRWVHVVAANTSRVPRYAYVQAAKSASGLSTYDPSTGHSVISQTETAMSVSLIDGKPMAQAEMAVLIQPGASVTFDILVPHKPVSRDRADRIAKEKFVEHRDGCRAYWQGKLEGGASISVPEKAIDERIRAGLLHLDLATLGMEEQGPLLATVGWYSPIGSESSPIIQFYDSMGWHKIAERSIQFFLDRQRDDGFIQTFGGYQLETGPTLWTIGEHFRYTRDEAWARRIKDRVFKACGYTIEWRRRNQRDELRGKGYGLLDGKVADPEDYFRSFMLNGLAYLGLKRVAEMYTKIDPEYSAELARECHAFLKDIRVAYLENVASSPVVALGDGTWAPTFGPWAEHSGPVSLFAEGGEWNSHGAFACRDTLIGALYLVIGEVLDANEPAAEWLVRAHQELMTHRNAGLSQPYYCRHDWIHLNRGEVKQFLKTYYNQVASLQDRQTYTFWEHYYGVSQHKTHEEGWFLMQTRWMLWHEEGDALKLLSMIPRQWMEDGKSIELKNCVSYFGKINLRATSHVSSGSIEVQVKCEAGRAPKRIEIRLPHPNGQRAKSVSKGRYDTERESVILDTFDGATDVKLMF